MRLGWRVDVPQPDAALRGPVRGRDGHAGPGLAPAGHRDRRRVHGRRGRSTCSAQAGQRVEDNTVFLDPDFVLEQVAKAPQGVRPPGPQPRELDRTSAATRWPSARVYGPPFVREGDVRRDGDDGRLPQLLPAGPELRGARLRGRRGHRAQRHPARQPPPRHDLRAADADRQDLHGQRRLRRQRRATRSR